MVIIYKGFDKHLECIASVFTFTFTFAYSTFDKLYIQVSHDIIEFNRTVKLKEWELIIMLYNKGFVCVAKCVRAWGFVHPITY